MGRLHDENAGRKINPKDYGLDDTHAALLVFAAAWCKPCMSEIHSLNRANSELSDKVQIAGFMVEGAQKGVPAAPKDSDLFVTPAGEHPSYRLTADSAWKLFDALQPSSGRSLPTMVFVNRDHVVIRIVQRSMEYETELLPLLRALASDSTEVPGPKPGPVEDPQGKPVNMTFAEWSAVADNIPGSAVYVNVEAAWRTGLEKFTWTEDSMPFASARMTIYAYNDGRRKLLSAIWVAEDTGCKLTVYFNPDGTYDRSEGICR